MIVHPDPESFRNLHDRGLPQVVWTTLVADLETPVSAMLKLSHGQAGSFLLESVEGGAVRGRYSIIGLKPDIIWRCHGTDAEINRDALADPETGFIADGKTLESLRRLVAESRMDLPEDLPPMAAGIVGYMGYDTVRLIERLPDDNPDPIGAPDGLFVRPTVMAIFDTILDRITVVTPARPKAGESAETALSRARARLEEAVAALDKSLPHAASDEDPRHETPVPVSNMDRAGFHAMVKKAKAYIAAGDIFQVVLSQRFRLPFTLPPFALYRALRRTNPSPFLFYLDFGRFSLIGSSPEILVRVRDGKVTIRPIAGTRKRGRDRAEDLALERELLADPKELSEHLMLLDLGRNDVGRVAKVGSVRVTERNIIERYSHVMHIVSNVEGVLDESRFDAMDALMAGFPAGTVSGAPKVRAMEIIEELEPERRGFYAGAIGYFSANGSMDTCIALRTSLVKDGVMYVQAGGGIVADSDPEGEYQESVNKAMALVKAAEEAVRFAADEALERQ